MGKLASLASALIMVAGGGCCDDEDDGFVLRSMSPAAEARTATPRTTVVLTFSDAVDPTTADPSSVVLRERESRRVVPARVEVADEVVTLTPLRPLTANYRYTVELRQIGSLDPTDARLDHVARFFTAPSFERLYLRYPAAGTAPTRSHVYAWDAGARRLAIRHYTVGADATLLTGDDVEDVWEELQFDGEQDYVAKRVMAVGPDLVRGTADDVDVYARSMTYVAAGLASREIVDHGADGRPGTADDARTLETYAYDAADRPLGSCDGTACTRVEHGAGEVAVVTLEAPGPDGVWRTGDDVPASPWLRKRYDAVGVELGAETHALAADGTATVTPTSLRGYTDYELDGGLPIAVRTYTGAGVDGVWRTADDVGSTFVTLTYAADGTRTGMQVFTAGGDGRLATADDVLYEDWRY